MKETQRHLAGILLLFAPRGVPGRWAGLWLLLPMLGLHLLVVRHWRSEALLMLAVATLGGSFDSLLATAGFYDFDTASQTLPIPLWLVAIWLAFAWNWMVAK